MPVANSARGRRSSLIERLENRCLLSVNLISDGGFEKPTIPVGSFKAYATNQALGNSWKVVGPLNDPQSVALVQTKYQNGGAFNAQEGLNSVDLGGRTNQPASTGVQQTITTVAGHTYQLSFWLGRGGTTPDRLMLRINNGAPTTFVNTGFTASRINWKQFTKSFTASGSSTTLAFLNDQVNAFTGLDNVSVTAVTSGAISGTVFNDINGNGTTDGSDAGIAGITVFLDKNKNGTLDSGEPSTVTNSSGAYAFNNLSLATYSVRAVLPKTYRASTDNPVSVNLQGSTGKANFHISQTALISGNVFHDANGNKLKDSGETGQSGVVVYLDLNNNGVFDFLDVKTTSDAKGNYQFAVPFGTYVIRETAPKGFTQTTSVLTLTVKQGQVSNGNNIGNQ